MRTRRGFVIDEVAFETKWRKNPSLSANDKGKRLANKSLFLLKKRESRRRGMRTRRGFVIDEVAFETKWRKNPSLSANDKKERGLRKSLFFYTPPTNYTLLYMRILFICLGNICRSPLAETILNAKLAAAGLHAEVDSAGLIAYHAGEQADPRMRAHAARRGYNITHRARQITQTDFFRFDLIIGMDADNQRALQQLAPAQTAHKIRTAVSYCDKFRHTDAVPDPYYGGDAGFEYAIDLLEDACDGIIATLRH